MLTLNNSEAALQKFDLDKNFGHVTQISKTSNPREIMLACSKGLFFCNISDESQATSVKLNQEESYFIGQDIKSSIEINKDVIAACFDEDGNVHIIDRKTKSVIHKISYIQSKDNPLCMRVIPGFDIESMPYLLLRNKEGVYIINVKSGFSFKSFSS